MAALSGQRARTWVTRRRRPAREGPLLIVNAASIDPINNQADYDELLAAIQRMKKGRLYYNPLRSRGI